MSRRETDRYDERQSDYYRRDGRTERDYEEVDYRETQNQSSGPSRRNETVVKEKDSETVVSKGRRPRQPDFLREDYGRNDNSGQLVVRDDRREDDRYGNNRGSRTRVEGDEVVYRERSRSRNPPRGNIDEREEVDIRIRENDTERRPPPRVYRDRDEEEIVYRGSGPSRPPPGRTEVIEKEDITIKERDSFRPSRDRRQEEIDIDIRERDRGRNEDIDIDIRERSRSRSRSRSRNPPPRSVSRGNLVRKDKEEWIVRKRRSPSSSPSPPPRDYEKESIVIRRKERSPSPEPPREPSPEPLPEPVYRPPIIQEVITHHRHIDHGVEPAPLPIPLPSPRPPEKETKEEDIDINIHRQGIRNGKPFDENINIDLDIKERDRSRPAPRSVSRDVRSREIVTTRDRGGRYDDDVEAEADYYNRKISSRGYAGEAYNGATRDWGLVDIPPGTERVAMDGVGGGRQEVTWGRYNGERHGKFITGDRVYEGGYGPNGGPTPLPAPREDYRSDVRFSETRYERETTRGGGGRGERKWTEITKDLVIEEAIRECGYEFEESDGYFYVLEYLRYEDVLRLVEITEDIRRERRERIREIQWQAEERERSPKFLGPPPMPTIPPPPGMRPSRGYDERNYYYEKDVKYERDGGGGYRR